MAKMTVLTTAIAMLSLAALPFTVTTAQAAYDGTHCKAPGVCWEAQPNMPVQLQGSKYDPHHDPLEIAKQQKAEDDMMARNKIRVDNFKKTGKFVDDVSKIQH